MWRSTFVPETIFRRFISLMQMVERGGRSKLILTNSTDPDEELFLNLTH